MIVRNLKHNKKQRNRMAQESQTYVATVVRDDFFNDPFFKGEFFLLWFVRFWRSVKIFLLIMCWIITLEFQSSAFLANKNIENESYVFYTIKIKGRKIRNFKISPHFKTFKWYIFRLVGRLWCSHGRLEQNLSTSDLRFVSNSIKASKSTNGFAKFLSLSFLSTNVKMVPNSVL